MPEGRKTVTPMILVEQPGKMLDFLVAAFGAQTTGNQARLGNATLQTGKGRIAASLHYFVDDVDAAYRRTLAAGATVMMGAVGEPTDRSYGERSAFVQDPFGNRWFLAKRLGLDGQRTGELTPHLNPANARDLIAFLEAAFGAKTMEVHEHDGKVMHAAVMLGDSMVEMGESEPFPMALSLAVGDPATARAQALAAGATDGSDNSVVDPLGNHWFLRTNSA